MNCSRFEAVRRGWAAVCAEAQGLQFKWRPTLVVACATCALLIPEYHKGVWFNDFLRWAGGADFFRFCRAGQINYKLILQVVIPMLLIVLMRERLTDYGLGLGKVKTGLKLTLLFYVLYIPCFIVLFRNSGFQAYYGGITKNVHSWPEFLAKEVTVVSMLSLRTEFLYRGFLLFGIKRPYGAHAGVLVQIIPYVLVHAGKAPLEAFGSLPVGLALAYLALKTESIWYGAVLHGSIALLFNALILWLYFAGQ